MEAPRDPVRLSLRRIRSPCGLGLQWRAAADAERTSAWSGGAARCTEPGPHYYDVITALDWALHALKGYPRAWTERTTGDAGRGLASDDLVGLYALVHRPAARAEPTPVYDVTLLALRRRLQVFDAAAPRLSAA